MTAKRGTRPARRNTTNGARAQLVPTFGLHQRSDDGNAFMVIVLLLAAGAVGVHVLWTPLDVLITWGQPAGLSIATDPSGAKLRLDGVPLASTAPITVSVSRDRADHVLEATYPGYQVARETIRYDKAATLSYVLRLQRDPNAPPPAAAAPVLPNEPTSPRH